VTDAANIPLGGNFVIQEYFNVLVLLMTGGFSVHVARSATSAELGT
jgi:hypothetical protein